jgi:hypothetical protein
MSGLATYGANAILSGTAVPATLYVKLHTGNPGAAGTSNAAALNTRKSFTRSSPTAGVCNNLADIEWLGAPSDENITHCSIWDAVSGGNCWFISAASTPVDLDPGFSMVISTGDLVLTMLIWT